MFASCSLLQYFLTLVLASVGRLGFTESEAQVKKNLSCYYCFEIYFESNFAVKAMMPHALFLLAKDELEKK